MGVDLTSENLGKPGNGYDHNYCIAGTITSSNTTLNKVMTVRHKINGRKMEISSTAPGAQLYTCNFFNGHLGKNGIVHKKQAALAIETQDWPDSVNFVGKFPTSTIIEAGGSYRHETEFAF